MAASEIYREGEQRYIAVKYSVRGRDLGSTEEEAIERSTAGEICPGIHHRLGGRIREPTAFPAPLMIVLPVTILLISIILYTMFKSVKWAGLILDQPAMAPLGGLFALLSPYQLQCFIRRRFSRSVRSHGTNRRHYAGVHQSTASRGSHHSKMPRWKAPF